MEFSEITEDNGVYPGEYILYEPEQQIVVVGSYSRENNFIRALLRGRFLEDEISQFKKIQLSSPERKVFYKANCKRCKKSP